MCLPGSDLIQGNIKRPHVVFKQISGESGYFGSEWREEIRTSTRKKSHFFNNQSHLSEMVRRKVRKK